MKRRLLLLGALSALLALGLAPRAGAQSPRPPNVVFIYADDLGYGDSGAYGATRVQTPNIDRLAREGVRFTSAYSSSATCTPSRFSLMTGGYAFRHKGTDILPGDAALIVPTDRATLAKVFQRAGYHTGLVGKWHLGLGKPGDTIDWNQAIAPGPREVGFDESFMMAATADRVPCVYLQDQKVIGLTAADPLRVSYEKPFPGEPTGADEYDHLKMKWSIGHQGAIVDGISRIGFETGGTSALWKDEDRADLFTEKAVGFIERNKDKPFFLYFAPHDIHVPRVPAPRFVGRTPMGPRGDVIAELDWTVGQVLAALDRLHLANDTLVVFSSDNGPALDDGYDDGAVELLGDHKPAGPWKGGKYSVYEGGTRMPMIVRWPGHAKPGVSDALFSQVDFAATFAKMLGQKTALGDLPDSRDALPVLLNQTAKGRASLVEQGDGVLGLREGKWKYIEPSAGPAYDRATGDPTGHDLKPQLFDLESDPHENQNLAEKNPAVAAAMAARLAELKAAPDAH